MFFIFILQIQVVSISVKNVTKKYGNQNALDNISFEISKGEIVGFLGPNGAGKSTSMKIITCFIPQTHGKVKVCGLDVNDEPIKVKRKVGYLPEHNPLYLDMYVKEYLLFLARLHKVKKKKERVAEMIKSVGLEMEQHKKIGALSKGYRQRVGLAQAMLHNPEVLILDEPTSGLDPNQLVEIRELIKTFGKDKTILLSTHIMQEVEAICDRIIIINDGRIVADEKASEIKSKVVKKQVVKVEFDTSISKSKLTSISGVTSAKEVSNKIWILESKTDKDIRKEISKFAQTNSILVLTMQKEDETLENVFKELTSKK